MARSHPPSQVIATWILSDCSSSDWRSLDELLVEILTVRLPKYSTVEIADLAESELDYVTEQIQETLAQSEFDGRVSTHQIDSETPPYIRFTGENVSELLAKLKRIDPFVFEEVCSEILSKIGCNSQVTQRTRDGGIDFIGTGLDILPDEIGCPAYCKAAVIGQAKRYSTKYIAEKSLREFVGASLLQKHKLRINQKLSPLTPVLLAFWTTSDFDPSSKVYARNTGVWLMDGNTISTYIRQLDLEEWVYSLPDQNPGAN